MLNVSEGTSGMVRTSETDPIRVDFIPALAHGLRGRLGLTFAPGKSYSTVTGAWNRDLATDLRVLRDDIGTDVLVTLLEPFEMHRASIPNLRDAARRVGLESLALPIPDLGAPRSVDDAGLLVGDMLDRIEAGRTVVVHCMGGLGRAGTIAACCLVARGLEPAGAIRAVRAARPGAVQTSTQEAFVAHFRDYVREG